MLNSTVYLLVAVGHCDIISKFIDSRAKMRILISTSHICKEGVSLMSLNSSEEILIFKY